MAELAGRRADLAQLVAEFGGALHAAGLPVGPDRCERFARAITLVRPQRTAALRWCARATLAAHPGQLELLDRVFDAVFGGLLDPADERGDPNAPELPGAPTASIVPPARSTEGTAGAGQSDADPGPGRPGTQQVALPTLGSAAERLAGRDFAELTEAELLLLTEVLRSLRLATPARRSRRTRRVSQGNRVDLRSTLRQAHRTGGDALHLARQRARDKPRRLVVLCDISGSMAPYSRAMLQLLYCAAVGAPAEVFTFATRLTRLTRVLAGSAPGGALAAAGQAAPDWSGGTRIAGSLREFIDGYGRRGVARGAVIMIISDGWEAGDPAQVGVQMARLSRLAYRIVWVNPRTARPGYQPLVGGMAAAWPHCDAVVSAHRLTALSDLLTALADPVRRRRSLFREEER